MAVTSIIVNFHTARFLPALLQDLSDYGQMETICIVDNSGEVDPASLRTASGLDTRSHPEIKVITPGKNLGFSAGVNLAAEKTDSEYVFLVNPDIRLLDGCIDNLVNACKKYQAVIAGPRFFWDDARQFKLPPSQGTASWMEYALAVSDVSTLDQNLLSFYWEMRHERFWEKTTPFAEPFLSGACMLINRKWAYGHFQSVLDDRYFLYHEDNDICVQAVNDGISPLCVPAAQAVHYYNQAPEPDAGKASLMVDSFQKYKEKYYPHVNWTLDAFTDEPDVSDEPDASVPLTDGQNGFDWQPFVPRGRLFFEIGINFTFVPFVQTEIFPGPDLKWPKKFVLCPDIWKQLADGVYYCRLRDNIKGTVHIWKWQKK